MEQSPSAEAKMFAASQDILRVLQNPKVNHRIRKYTSLVTIRNQLNPVHTPTSHYLKIHHINILTSKLGSPKWFFPSRFASKIL